MLSKLILISLLVSIHLGFSGCERIVYVKVPCPTLITFDINSSEVDEYEEIEYVIRPKKSNN